MQLWKVNFEKLIWTLSCASHRTHWNFFPWIQIWHGDGKLQAYDSNIDEIFLKDPC